jgi:hypothetical protein
MTWNWCYSSKLWVLTSDNCFLDLYFYSFKNQQNRIISGFPVGADVQLCSLIDIESFTIIAYVPN